MRDNLFSLIRRQRLRADKEQKNYPSNKYLRLKPTKYIEISGKKRDISALKKDVKESEFVYLATDPDREGEAISWHLYDELGIKDNNYERVVFNEITAPAVKEAFNQLEQSGKVKHFGVSNMNRYQMELLQSGIDQKLWTNQLQMSIAHTPIIDAGINVNTQFDGGIMRDGGVLEYCRMNEVALQTWSPLQKGFFEGTFLDHESYRELNELLTQLATKYNVEKDSIAYAWLLRLPTQVQVITGTSKKERLVNAAKATDIKLTKKEWYDIYKAAGNQLP